jgi:hypothetical protein
VPSSGASLSGPLDARSHSSKHYERALNSGGPAAVLRTAKPGIWWPTRSEGIGIRRAAH